MGGPEGAFELETTDVVFESFADETIAVHLGTGRYFSINMTGAEVLDLLRSGNEVGAIIADLAARSASDPQVVDRAVADFVARLLEEGLIRAAASGAPATLPGGSRSSAPFSAPTIAVYTDMEDLLLLDPIHDVDETGWPAHADSTEGTHGAAHAPE